MELAFSIAVPLHYLLQTHVGRPVLGPRCGKAIGVGSNLDVFATPCRTVSGKRPGKKAPTERRYPTHSARCSLSRAQIWSYAVWSTASERADAITTFYPEWATSFRKSAEQPLNAHPAGCQTFAVSIGHNEGVPSPHHVASSWPIPFSLMNATPKLPHDKLVPAFQTAYLHSLLGSRLVRGLGRPSNPRRGREVLRLLLDAPTGAASTSACASAGLGVVNDSSTACLPCPQRSPIRYMLRREPLRKRDVGRHRQ